MAEENGFWDTINDYTGQAVDYGTNVIGELVTNTQKATADFVSKAGYKTGPDRDIPGPTAGKFNPNKYSIDQFSYPNDLMSAVYGGNYAIFYINVAVESFLNVAGTTYELDKNTEPRMRGDLVAKNLTRNQLAVAEGISTAVGGTLTGSGPDLKASGLAAGAATVAGVFAPDASRSQRRMKTAIALHVPNQLSVRYGMQWSEEDTLLLQAASDGVQQALSRQGATGKLTGVGAAGVSALAAVGLQKTSGGVSSALGIAANPKKEQTFKGVDFRKFTFDYQFYPRSADEAKNVLNIIQQFKLHMHPEFKSDLNYLWIYPSEFDIIYYTNGVENLNLHRHTSCVLEEMSVNYTPNGNFNTFANGMPTQINITLGFRELQILSRETVMGGL